MKMVILRDFSRTESDDWKLNVQDYIGEMEESVEIHDSDGKVAGWKIQSRYE